MVNPGRDGATYERQEHAHEPEPPDRPGARQLFPASAFSSVIARWLDLAAHQQLALGPATRQARRICGRWIRQRRYALGLDEQRLAAIIGVNATTVQLIELGLGGDDQMCDAHRVRLIQALMHSDEEADWVAAVVEGALGRRDDQLATIAGRAATSLRDVGMGTDRS